MRHRHHITASVLLCGAIVAGTAACGGKGAATAGAGTASSASSSASAAASASVDPFDGMTGTQIVNAADATLKTVPTLRLQGTMTDSGQQMRMDLTIVRGVGCTGTVGEGSQGTIAMVVLGKTVWLKMDATFLKSMGSNAATKTLIGKYVKTKTSGSSLSSVASFCDLDSFAKSVKKETDSYTKGGLSTVNGVQVIALTDTSDKSVLSVTTAKPHEVVRATGTATEPGLMNMEYSAGVKITPPPAAEVVDGSKYGL